jgi:hypothetical protein
MTLSFFEVAVFAYRKSHNSAMVGVQADIHVSAPC